MAAVCIKYVTPVSGCTLLFLDEAGAVPFFMGCCMINCMCALHTVIDQETTATGKQDFMCHKLCGKTEMLLHNVLHCSQYLGKHPSLYL